MKEQNELKRKLRKGDAITKKGGMAIEKLEGLDDWKKEIQELFWG